MTPFLTPLNLVKVKSNVLHRLQRSYFSPWLWLTFSVDTANRLCFTVGSRKTSCDRVTNLVRYYPMLWKTSEGNDCGRITAAFQMRCPSGDVLSHRALDNILPGLYPAKQAYFANRTIWMLNWQRVGVSQKRFQGTGWWVKIAEGQGFSLPAPPPLVFQLLLW